MRVRALLFLTSILSLLAGAAVVYIALTVPQDIAANRMLRDARAELSRGDIAAARARLETLIQQYPRTDAAAAATVALSEIVRRDQMDLESRYTKLAQNAERQQHTIDALVTEVAALSNAAKAAADALAAAPVVVTPPPKPAHSSVKRRRRR